MARAAKYESYEAWVVGRIGRARNKMMTTTSLLRIPQYLAMLECLEVRRGLDGKPDPEELSQQQRSCEDRLRTLRNGGAIASINKRWYLR